MTARSLVCGVGGAFVARYAGGQNGAAAADRSSKSKASNGSASKTDSEGEWMQRARRLANQRAAQFRKERGQPPVAPALWRRKRRGDAGDEESSTNFVRAARAYDDLPGRRVKDGEVEMTATAGDGLWRVDMAELNEQDWASQWTMTSDEWTALRKDVKSNASGPLEALRGFEDSGLRRVSPDIASGMLRLIADKAKETRMDREALVGLRRDSRVAHLVGTCVAAARRNSDALSASSVADAAWALAVIAGERANAAEMEVLAERAALLVDQMRPRQTVDLSWALASCRHSSRAVFEALDFKFANDSGLQKYTPYDVSTLAWAFAHLGSSTGAGFVEGLDRWFANGDAGEVFSCEDSAGAASKRAESFSPGALATALWGLTVLGGDATRSFAFRSLWNALGAIGSGVEVPADDAARAAREHGFGPFIGKHLNQIYQASVAVSTSGGCEASGLTPLPAALVAAAENAWNAQRRPPVTSWYQRDVASILSYMGEKHEEEATCAGYRVDLFLPELTDGASANVAVEVDGPSHFARNDQSVALGQTRLKHRQLRALGYAVVSVPVQDWEYLETSEEKVEYLRGGFATAEAERDA